MNKTLDRAGTIPYLTFICLLITNLSLRAQSISPHCGTQESPSHTKAKQQRANSLYSPGQLVDTSTVYTIPVVFIVYHLGEPVGSGSNLSDAHILAQLNQLNRNFAAQRIDYRGIDSKIRFELARRSPSCTNSNGILRVDGRAVSGYQQQGLDPDDRIRDIQLQALLPEYIGNGNDRFITVRIIHTARQNSGWSAYGGIYVAVPFLTPESSLLTHEVGHVCGLAHTFTGSGSYNNYSCPANTNPEQNGDGVVDTDPHKMYEPYNACDPASEQQINSCTNRPFGLIGRNYMSYGCDTKLFTRGQILRMRSYLSQPFRRELINSAYLTPPLATDTIRTACKPISVSALTPHSEGVWSVTIGQLSNETYSNTYNNGLNYYDYSCTKRVTLTVGESYPISVWGWGRHRRVYLDSNNDGLFDEGTERLFTEDRMNNNSIETSYASLIIPPSTVTNRYLRLRIIVDGGTSPPTACNLPGSRNGSGEAEDYGILVVPACPAMRTLKAGNWIDPSVWSCGRLPTLADIVEVLHAVELQAGESGQASLLLYGTGGSLHIATGAQLVLK